MFEDAAIRFSSYFGMLTVKISARISLSASDFDVLLLHSRKYLVRRFQMKSLPTHERKRFIIDAVM